MQINNFPELRQMGNYDCGPVALQAILAYWGIDVREDELIKLCLTTKENGTEREGLKKAAEHFGLTCKAASLTFDDVKEYISQQIPVLIDLQAWADHPERDWTKDWEDGHYVVAIGYDKDKIYFEDPSAFVRTFLTIEELKSRWHDVTDDGKKFYSWAMAVIGDPKKIRRPDIAIHLN